MPWSEANPMDGMSQEQQDEYFEIGQEHSEKHQELSRLLFFPPFTLDKDDFEEFRQAIIAVTEEQFTLFKRTQAVDRDAYAQLEQEFADEIEEAKLYKARHGDDEHAAQDAAIADSGMSKDDEQLYQLEPK